MRVRFAGSVIIVNNKGIITLTVSLLCFCIILFLFQTLFLKVNDDITETNVLSIDKVLQEKNLLKPQDDIKRDSIGEKGNKVKIDFQKDVGSLKKHDGNFMKIEANNKLSNDKYMHQKSIDKMREEDDKKMSIDEKNYRKNPIENLPPRKNEMTIDEKNYRKNQLENLPAGKVEMAMDVIPVEARMKMEMAAKSMHLPHRPPDSHYNINVTLSDHTSLDRDIPDTRPTVCASIPYDLSVMPKVSIIIPFFNEAPTMLLRNIHSILNRTPNQLLEEIILVDDMSYDAPLQSPLEKFIEHDSRLSLIRNEDRYGLIVSRMRGARAAKAPVILFLDAHSEVNVGWIEPILDQLVKNPKQVLQPFIDGIDNMNLAFAPPSNYFKGTFSWDLRYTWTKLTDHEQERVIKTGQPYDTPTIVGCAIAVYKDYFFEIGSFDEGMYVWGGENLELAFRAWMCGGKAATVTCSRVGHVFKQSPNKFDGTKQKKEITIQKNLIRVADVWMDGMRKYFYATTLMFDFKRYKLDAKDIETLKERTELRKKLKCHNFEWYLYNVFPEMLELPPMDSAYFGEIMNIQSRGCWEITPDYQVGMTYFCFEHKIIPKNNFVFLRNGMLKYRDKCVKTNLPEPHLSLGECPEEKDIAKFGRWEVENRGPNWGSIKVFVKDDDGVTYFWCIVQVTNALKKHKGEQMPQLGQCNVNDGFQLWSFTYPVDFTLVNEYMDIYKQNPYE